MALDSSSMEDQAAGGIAPILNGLALQAVKQ